MGRLPESGLGGLPIPVLGGLIQMISYQISDEGTFPRLFCDVCHKPIRDRNGFAHSGKSGEIAYVHAGKCDRKIKHTPASFFGSESLTAFFTRLLLNTKIGPNELKELEETDRLRDGFIGIVSSRKKLDQALR